MTKWDRYETSKAVPFSIISAMMDSKNWGGEVGDWEPGTISNPYDEWEEEDFDEFFEQAEYEYELEQEAIRRGMVRERKAEIREYYM